MEEQAPEKVIINGEEYDPNEAHEYISLGRKTKEYEQKWNTPLDNVWPEYGKSRETVKKLESELQDARSKLEQFQSKQEAGVETPNDIAQAKEAARKLGIPFKEDLEKEGYIRKDDLQKFLDERDEQKDARQKILSEADRLEKEIDGTDGRPKFNKRNVLAYAATYGIADLQKAYEEMYEDQVKPWKEQQIALKKDPSLKTLTASQGNKSPKQDKITDDNVNGLLKEKLWGAKE